MTSIPTRLLLLLFIITIPVSAEEFSFDASEYEKKTFDFSGYIEGKQEAIQLQPERPVYTFIG